VVVVLNEEARCGMLGTRRSRGTLERGGPW
jgi:hypothetical protein